MHAIFNVPAALTLHTPKQVAQRLETCCFAFVNAILFSYTLITREKLVSLYTFGVCAQMLWFNNIVMHLGAVK